LFDLDGPLMFFWQGHARNPSPHDFCNTWPRSP
jgi:hypothetical protein